VKPKITLYCQIWFDGMVEPTVVKASLTYIWNRAWGYQNEEGVYHPYLISCPIPVERLDTVSIKLMVQARKLDT